MNAWIDFNGNGVFDSGEQIATGLPVVNGENDVTFIVPANATLGNTFARFRLSTTRNSDPVRRRPTAGTPDGEVEDYQVAILPPPAIISGTAGNDLNGNGVQETGVSGEPGQAGRTIYLDANNNGQLDAGERSTTTAADRLLEFYDVTPGTYQVCEVPMTGWSVTDPAAGNYPVTVAVGDQDTGMNFGNHDIVPPVVTVNPLRDEEQHADRQRHGFGSRRRHGCIQRDRQVSAA